MHRVNYFKAILFLWITLPYFFAAHAQAQTSPTWRLKRLSIERQIADDLQELAAWCRSQDRSDWAEESFGWYRKLDTGRQYIYVASEKSRSFSRDPLQKEFEQKLASVKQSHAERILELAKQAAEQDSGAVAYQLLHEVLFYHPDHEAVREMLGHRKTEDGWRVSSDRLRIKKPTRPHHRMKWRKDEFLLVSTAHFNIASQADEATTRLLAEKLERWQGIWRQVFLEFWNRPSNVKRWIAGKSSAKIPSKKFDIVFFRNRQAYIDDLSKTVKGIEASTGYYDDGDEVSYFYASEEKRIHNTWRHEVTHQLFQESIRTKSSPFDDEFIWLGEGIAMYFESLSDHGDYVTLGGFDSKRLQYARIRKFREGFSVPLAEMSSQGRVDFQRNPDVARLYSLSAGFAHMLMDDEDGGHQKPLTEFLKLMYQGKLKPGVFEKLIGKSYEELDDQYSKYLKVQSDEIANGLSLPGERTELALPAAKLDDEAFEAIGQCHRLIWLDLTANQVSGKQMKQLENCKQLSQLFLTNCAITPETTRELNALANLTEIDFSGSSLTDKALMEIRPALPLNNLRMVKTRVTDEGLKHLAKFTTLTSIDITGANVTSKGVDWLKSKLPNLKVIQNSQ